MIDSPPDAATVSSADDPPVPLRERLAAALAGLPWARLALEAVALVLLAVVLPISRGGWYVVRPLADLAPAAAATDGSQAAALERRIASLAPRGTWVAVDTYANRLRVFKNDEVLRDALCSTGSGTILRDPASEREWVFDTPQGERRVQRKVKDPVWIKPDWAFIEEGYEPPRMFRDRVDRLSLGDYGLYLGDGYIIHGTLFKTLLGRRVTHGCIRLGDEDLEWVYWRVPLGARVYLY